MVLKYILKSPVRTNLSGLFCFRSPFPVPCEPKTSKIIIQDVSNHVLKRLWVFKGETLIHQFNETKVLQTF